MQYLLVQNRSSVLLGPVFWQPRFITSILSDAGVDWTSTPVGPETVQQITDNTEIFPVIGITQPAYNPVFEQLAGPYWDYSDAGAAGHYTIVQRELSAIRSTLLGQTAAERWQREIDGIQYTIGDQTVTVATDRESRNVYTQKILSLDDTTTVQWKFPQGWVAVTKTDLIALLGAIDAHVQAQYDWEAGIVEQISAAQTVTELQEIVISETTQGELV